MPKTKFQSFVFTLLMAFFMVFCMSSYSIAINQGSLSYDVFRLAIREMWIEFVIICFLEGFVITKLALKLARSVLNPAEVPPILFTVAMQCFTVCLTVPVITLIATFLHNGMTTNWLVLWIQQAVLCFPMALCIQVFYVGPLVRLIFRKLFTN